LYSHCYGITRILFLMNTNTNTTNLEWIRLIKMLMYVTRITPRDQSDIHRHHQLEPLWDLLKSQAISIIYNCYNRIIHKVYPKEKTEGKFYQNWD
jgi:hypothetical protein